MKQKPVWYATALTNRQFSIVTSKVIVCLMMSTLAYTFGLFAEKVFAFGPLMFVVVMAFLVSLIVFFIHPLVKFSPLDNTNRLIYQISELIVLVVILKLASYLFTGFDNLVLDVMKWRENFLVNFFTPHFIFTIALILSIWFLDFIFASNIDLLHDIEELTDWENIGGIQNDLYQTRHEMTDRVLVIGMIIVIVAVLTNTELKVSSVVYHVSILASPHVMSILVYFVLAFVLLSLSQLAALRTRWSIRKLQISPVLVKNWIRYAPIFFILLAFIAIILPTDYTLGLLDTLYVVLNAVISFLFAIISIAIYLFTVLIVKLFGSGTTPSQIIPLGIIPLKAAPEAANAAPISWFEELKSIFFWVIFITIVGAAIIQYLRQNRLVVDKIKQLKLLKPISNLLARFWQWVMGVNQKLSGTVIDRVRQILQKRADSINKSIQEQTLNWRNLSPREKVIQQYQTLITTGDQYGMGRKNSYTPNRYAEFLNSILPEESHMDIDHLTEEFMEARYTDHPITGQSSNRVRQYLSRIIGFITNREKVDKKD